MAMVMLNRENLDWEIWRTGSKAEEVADMFTTVEAFEEYQDEMTGSDRKWVKCSVCGYYYQYADVAGEFEHNGNTFYEVCHECCEDIERGVNVALIDFKGHADEVEDYLEDMYDDIEEYDEDYYGANEWRW